VSEHEIEDLLRRVPDVEGCRVQADAAGVIAHVHVTTRGARAPGEAAGAGQSVDPARIQITVIGAPPVDAEIAILEELEHEVRIRLTGIRTHSSDESARVEVDLTMSPTESAVGYATAHGGVLTPDLFAAAALDAVERLVGGRVSLRVLALHRTSTGAYDVLSVTVQEFDGRDMRVHAGAARIDADAGRAAAYAALAALNRRIGRILTGPGRHYRIA
jgi:hypothetical protein